METIKNYLENMFMSLPDTPEVYRAKDELLQMMEDKYTELKSEGKSENEAVGIVISEFGNLDEIASDLGIENIVCSQPQPEKKLFTLDEVKRYIKDKKKHSTLIAAGVALCILSVCFPIFFDGLAGTASSLADLYEAVGACLMFILIAVAVALFVYSAISVSSWKYLNSEPHVTDRATTEYINEQMNLYRHIYAIMLVVGIALCIISVTPAILIDAMHNADTDFADNLSGGLLFVLVAAGVFLIVNASLTFGIYKHLLSLNDTSTVSGNYVSGQKERVVYDNENVAIVMSVFWQTVTCLYLCVSFLTFQWSITWIIWPVAALVNSMVKNIYGHK